ncbi:DUF6440 family protein [Ruminococcaceae bacterium OttesenSCG-928-I18]|nr:DUF6440 family protein [Ruminococcaceae bacterium OttesenSCG-928-I18]
MADKKRFKTVTKEAKALKGTSVIVDSQTGVQYLYVWDGYGGGLTVLVDKDGKPLLAK